MSEIMTQGIIRMPFEMAMEGELSRKQFYDRAQRVLDENESLRHQLADATRKMEEARKDAELGAAIRPNYEAAKELGMSYIKWTVESIDQAIEQGKGGDDA
jgi:hypothetical protein